jgi:hypothetical protein
MPAKRVATEPDESTALRRRHGTHALATLGRRHSTHALAAEPDERPRCAAGQIATVEDWESHLSTVFPDVRMKRFLEMRGADGGPWKMICAMPALWVGLLYNAAAQRDALALISDWTVDEMTTLRNEVRSKARASCTAQWRCTSHCAPLTAHLSLRTSHCAPLTAHLSLRTSLYSHFTRNMHRTPNAGS